jgi:hypothetical protein
VEDLDLGVIQAIRLNSKVIDLDCSGYGEASGFEALGESAGPSEQVDRREPLILDQEGLLAMLALNSVETYAQPGDYTTRGGGNAISKQ